MYLNKRFLFTILFCFAAGYGNAQSDVDAIRYSQIYPTITARSLAMGGAFGALGADFSALSFNPAGIGLYRKSEFTITPSLENISTESSFFNVKNRDNKYNFSLGNIGLVWAYPSEKENSPWKGWALGIGYNRLNNFHTRSFYEGVNPSNSLLNFYAESANGIEYSKLEDNDPFGSNLAFQTYLIDTLPGTTNQYFGAVPSGGTLQRRLKETRGSLGEAVISAGGNYDHRIYWGLTLGFPYIRYNEDVLYEEIDNGDQVYQTTPGVDSAYAAVFNFKSMSLIQNIATTGNGFNAKFGMIFRATDYLRFGFSVHSPGFFRMHDEYIYRMSSKFENGAGITFDSPTGMYDYNLTTPLRVSGNAAYIIQQQGIISLDYEFVDYTSAKLDATDYTFSSENQTIRNFYTQGNNLRLGAEWKYGIFAFRGGLAYYGALAKSSLSSSSTDQHKYIYSGGVGLREESFFLDLGYSFSQGNGFYRPYELANANVEGVFSKVNEHRILLTVGFRF